MAGPAAGVTGATGRVGGGVARRLAEAGVSQRMIVGDPDRAPRLPRAEVAGAEFGDAEAARAALMGIRTLFMVSAGETDDRVAQHRAFIDAAVVTGVERVVYLSLVGARADATFTLARHHWATEEHIRESGCTWASLVARVSWVPRPPPQVATRASGSHAAPGRGYNLQATIG